MSRRIRVLVLASAALAAASLGLLGCFSPSERDGSVRCGTGQSCPPRFTCRVDGLCYRSGAMVVDAGPIDGSLGDGATDANNLIDTGVPDGEAIDGDVIDTGVSDALVTDATPAGTTHVGDLDGVRRPNGALEVTVTVHDAAHAPASNVLVSATFTSTGSTNQTTNRTCTTAANGICTVNSGAVAAGSTTVLRVTNLTRVDLTYVSANNHDPEADSNGTELSNLLP